MVPGGRVELPTPAFSGPRSTGELPRHRSSEKIVRAREAGSKRSEVGLVGQFPITGLERSHPAADATREVSRALVACWLR
jgi:hypothetical protein